MTIEKNIEIVRDALEARYDFPYYALVRVETRHYGRFHLPAPWFNGPANSPRSRWAGSLPIAQDKRDGEYYTCPFCGETSFYAGPCQDCCGEFEVWEEDPDGDGGNWEEGPLPIEYRNHEALKKSVKEELLRRIDSDIQSLGIISAEIVLAVPWGAEWDPSPFFKEASFFAQMAFARIYRNLEYFNRGRENSIEIIEGEDFVSMPASDEKKVLRDGIYYHRHGGTESLPQNNHDYWHPMARVHKEEREKVQKEQEAKNKNKKTFRLEDTPSNNHGCSGFWIDIEVNPEDSKKGIIVGAYQCTHNYHGLPSSNWWKEGDRIELPEEFSSWEEASEWENDETSFSSAGHTKYTP